MVATAIYSVTMVLWKETAFPFCRAMERHWKRNVVSRVSSVIVVIRLPLLLLFFILYFFIFYTPVGKDPRGRKLKKLKSKCRMVIGP